MLTKLENYNKFKKEIQTYQVAVDKIQDENRKKYYSLLLAELKLQSRIIDEAHNPLTNKSIDPRQIRENVEKIMSIRQQLSKVVKDSRY